MQTLEDLPHELRQQIFSYAFEDAAAKDIKFHDNIYSCLWWNEYNCPRLIESYEMPNCLEQALRHDDEDDESSPPSKEITYAPHLYDLASKLCLVFPDSRDDVVFVLGKIMEKTYAEDGSIIAKRKGARRYHRDAVEEYGVRAERNWCAHDDGSSVWILARGDVKNYKWITPDELREEKEHEFDDDWNEEESDWLLVARSVYSTYDDGCRAIDGYRGLGFKPRAESLRG